MEHDRESTEQGARESTEQGAPHSAPGVAGASNAGERTVIEQHEGDFVAGEHDGPYGGPGSDAREKQEEGDRELGTEGK
jgi:hypothetical protein